MPEVKIKYVTVETSFQSPVTPKQLPRRYTMLTVKITNVTASLLGLLLQYSLGRGEVDKVSSVNIVLTDLLISQAYLMILVIVAVV